MPQMNYRQMKRRREEAQKKEQIEKQARRGRVRPTDAPSDVTPEAPATPNPGAPRSG